MLYKLQQEIHSLVNSQKAKDLQRFFKTGKGEYGEGDVFLGITVPQIRTLVKKYRELSSLGIDKLLRSSFHEERLTALLILVEQFKKGDEKVKSSIFEFYLSNTRYINNWDLVDLTAPNIIGQYLQNCHVTVLCNAVTTSKLLSKLTKSKNMWERRIAVLSTFIFIRNNKFDEALKIAEILLKDEEDLIHKAVGWMLREIGKRNKDAEKSFLNKYAGQMPRTMLRYAIEKFPEIERQKYLKIAP